MEHIEGHPIGFVKLARGDSPAWRQAVMLGLREAGWKW